MVEFMNKMYREKEQSSLFFRLRAKQFRAERFFSKINSFVELKKKSFPKNLEKKIFSKILTFDLEVADQVLRTGT